MDQWDAEWAPLGPLWGRTDRAEALRVRAPADTGTDPRDPRRVRSSTHSRPVVPLRRGCAQPDSRRQMPSGAGSSVAEHDRAGALRRVPSPRQALARSWRAYAGSPPMRYAGPEGRASGVPGRSATPRTRPYPLPRVARVEPLGAARQRRTRRRAHPRQNRRGRPSVTRPLSANSRSSTGSTAFASPVPPTAPGRRARAARSPAAPAVPASPRAAAPPEHAECADRRPRSARRRR